MDHLTEQDAGLLEQAASMLEKHAEEQRTRGNCSAAEGAACSAHAIRRLAPAMLRAGRGCLAQIEEPAPATFMTDDQAFEWAWNKVREDLGTKGWTAGDFGNFHGFFLHGWNYRGQYELQRSPAMAALKQELMTAAPALEAPPAVAPQGVEPQALVESIRELEAWEARADDGELTTSECEAVMLVLHELKRMRSQQLAADGLEQFERLDAQNHHLRRAMQRVMARLTNLLDEDQFADIESIVSAAGVTPPKPALEAPAAPAATDTDLAVLMNRSACQKYPNDINSRIAHNAGWKAARATLAAAPQAPAAPVVLPSGWVPCILTHDGQHPEEVAYGPQIMMDRLKKWLGRYFELLAQKVLAEPVHAEMLAALQAVAMDVVHVGAGENAVSDSSRAKVEAVLEKIGAPWPGPAAAPAAPAVDAETIHLQDLKNALAECTALRQQLTLMDEQQAGSVWRWQADGQDQLASMGSRMGVLIYACDLRALLAGTAPAVNAKPLLAPETELDAVVRDAEQIIRDAEHYRFIKRHRLILSGGTDTFGWPIAPFGDECDRYIAQELATERAAQAKEGGA